MKFILKRLALLSIPVLAWLAFFIAFEPNNYFGLKESSNSTAPIGRIRAYEADPGPRIILGDSRMAHFDLDLVEEVSGRPWQNLAFGGASLRETCDLLEYLLDNYPQLEEVVFGVSFYSLSAAYDVDRMSTLQDVLDNPLAYCFNLEYNVNTLTNFTDWLAGRQGGEETGDWVYPDDYTDAEGNVYPLHLQLALYPQSILPRCENFRINESQAQRLYELALRCEEQGVELTVVLPPVADYIMDTVCIPLGIDQKMGEFLVTLEGWSEECGFTLLDYEWTNRPDFDDDTQFYDGLHLDTRYGLPQFTEMLFTQVG